MFIRWIERPSKTPGVYTTSLSAILAESKRVDGRPRQRHIAYISGIQDVTDVVDAAIFGTVHVLLSTSLATKSHLLIASILRPSLRRGCHARPPVHIGRRHAKPP